MEQLEIYKAMSSIQTNTQKNEREFFEGDHVFA